MLQENVFWKYRLEHNSYSGMIYRCTNPRSKAWKYYGGTGVTVCDRWLKSFLFFVRDMGPRPGPNYSIDRFPNPYGNYEPGNCRWATPKQQARNQRRYVPRPGLKPEKPKPERIRLRLRDEDIYVPSTLAVNAGIAA